MQYFAGKERSSPNTGQVRRIRRERKQIILTLRCDFFQFFAPVTTLSEDGRADIVPPPCDAVVSRSRAQEKCACLKERITENMAKCIFSRTWLLSIFFALAATVQMSRRCFSKCAVFWSMQHRVMLVICSIHQVRVPPVSLPSHCVTLVPLARLIYGVADRRGGASGLVQVPRNARHERVAVPAKEARPEDS